MLNSGVQEAKKENNMRKVLVIVTMMLTVCVTAFGQEDGLIGMMTLEQEYSDWANFNIQWNPCTLVPKSGDSKSFTGISVGLESCGSLSGKKTTPFFGEFGIGLQYSFDSTNGVDFSMFSAKLNVGVGYDILIPNTPIALMPHAGLDCSFIFSAKSKGNGYTIDHFNADDMGGDDYKWDKMPIGWYAGIKAKVQDKVIIGFKYGMDFTELTKGVHMQTMTVSLGLCI